MQSLIKRYTLGFLIIGSWLVGISSAAAQLRTAENPVSEKTSLNELIRFALKHQGNIQKARIDEEIGEREIASALSGWYPQLSGTASYTRNIELPTSGVGENVLPVGQYYVGSVVFQTEQKILNPALMQASKAAGSIREKNVLQTELTTINTIVAVSKSFYDILTSHAQLAILKENIARLQKQLDDATARYETGIVDKTDYKRAQISLSNAKADLKRVEELLTYKYAYLKELVGLSPEQPLSLAYDYKIMEQEILLDTLERVNPANRVEYQQIQNLKRIQEINTQYNKWTFLPNISATYNYALDYRNNNANAFFDRNYPRSLFGVNLSIPIFQGMKRIHEIRKSKLQESRLDWDLYLLEAAINTEYQRALATYKSNLNDWKTAKENVELALEVYEVIQLQYNEGIKTYLDLMIAETELKSTQINYLNVLNAVLSGKIDAERALGKLSATQF